MLGRELAQLRVDRVKKAEQDRQLDQHREAAGKRIDAVFLVERHRCRLELLGFALVFGLQLLEQRLHFLHLRHRLELLLRERKERQAHDQRQQEHIQPVRRHHRVNGVEQAQHRVGDRLEEVEGEQRRPGTFQGSFQTALAAGQNVTDSPQANP